MKASLILVCKYHTSIKVFALSRLTNRTKTRKKPIVVTCKVWIYAYRLLRQKNDMKKKKKTYIFHIRSPYERREFAFTFIRCKILRAYFLPFFGQDLSRLVFTQKVSCFWFSYYRISYITLKVPSMQSLVVKADFRFVL